MPPDVRKNINLEQLELNQNELIVPPDITMNVNLTNLLLDMNQLTVAPKSNNGKLLRFSIRDNPLTEQAIRALREWNEKYRFSLSCPEVQTPGSSKTLIHAISILGSISLIASALFFSRKS